MVGLAEEVPSSRLNKHAFVTEHETNESRYPSKTSKYYAGKTVNNKTSIMHKKWQLTHVFW
jgi:hypothetical protein